MGKASLRERMIRSYLHGYRISSGELPKRKAATRTVERLLKLKRKLRGGEQ